MGHLVNPIGFRAGFSIVWRDVWYVRQTYYPRILNIISNLKLYLEFFFSGPLFTNLGIVFSHLNITKQYNSLHVSSFLYDGLAEEGIHKHIFRAKLWKWLPAKRIFWYRLVVYFTKKFFYRARIFSDSGKIIALSLISRKFSFARVSYALAVMFGSSYEKFNDDLSKRSWHNFESVLNCEVFTNLNRTDRQIVLLIIFIFMRIAKNKRFLILHRIGADICRKIVVLRLMKPFYKVLQVLLLKRLKTVVRGLNVSFSFFGLTNGTVTASIICKYIYYKLRHRHWVMQIMSPLRGELYRLIRPKGFYKSDFNYGKYRGFKIHLRGRFSRKQMASSMWWRIGRLPLTRTTANIDFIFKRVFLKNSVCSIKIWVYRTKNLSTFGYTIL